MYRYKVSNLYKIVINFSLYNNMLILANSSFGNNNFISNKNNYENSTFGTIYKSSDKIPKTKTNI